MTFSAWTITTSLVSSWVILCYCSNAHPATMFCQYLYHKFVFRNFNYWLKAHFLKERRDVERGNRNRLGGKSRSFKGWRASRGEPPWRGEKGDVDELLKGDKAKEIKPMIKLKLLQKCDQLPKQRVLNKVLQKSVKNLSQVNTYLM